MWNSNGNVERGRKSRKEKRGKERAKEREEKRGKRERVYHLPQIIRAFSGRMSERWRGQTQTLDVEETEDAFGEERDIYIYIYIREERGGEREEVFE